MSWFKKLLPPPKEMTAMEYAAQPRRIRELAGSLMWAYRNGYRPVPGYTVCERQEDGTLYVAMEMTKERT